MKEIILASNNKNKIKEIERLLEKFDVKVKSLNDLGLEDPIEDGKTFSENALIKARYAFEKTGLPSLADDSGFCVDSLNNFPGLCSARFEKAIGSYPEAMRVLSECINPKDKTSHFITVLAFIYKKDNKVNEEIFEGKIEGKFTFPIRGNNGFGYCPCFTPNGYSETFAEMSDEIRCKINHRAKALEKFTDFFEKIK